MLDSRFNSVEVLEMAKDIEKRGLEFYKAQAEKTDDQNLKDLLLKLAEDEQDHYNRFDKLVKFVKDKTGDEVEYVYDPEVSAYLEAIVEFSIFPADSEVELDSIHEALQLAIYAEKDSILFYQEMLENNKQNDTKVVLEKIIDEEKKHLLDLVKYDAELA